MTPLLLFIVLPLSACAVYLPWRNCTMVHSTAILSSILTFFIALNLGFGPIFSGTSRITQWWHIDAFSGFLLILIALLSFAAIIVSTGYLQQEEKEEHLMNRHIRFYYASLHLFVLGMMTTVIANNMMMLWLALESTTLSTTLLVAFYIKDGAIEAAWKYIVICSTGIALGLIGILMAMYAAAVSSPLADQSLFLLSSLREHAAALPPILMRASFVFVFVGIGTKVGLVPMHTWLPDAHSKTPSPVSALLPGILLYVALYTLPPV